MTKLNSLETLTAPELEEPQESVIRRLDIILLNHMNRGVEEVEKTQNRLTEFSDKLREHYPNFEDYRLWHLLVGSTPKSEKFLFDFPGEDSVQTFIENLPKLQGEVEDGDNAESVGNVKVRNLAREFARGENTVWKGENENKLP